ncbi:MAG: type II toxin-antitoxin system HigA family antitoxin [Akkermansiaceae bacterium]
MSRTRNKKSMPKFSALPKIYAALCRLHMPRTIHDDIELDAVTEIIDHMAGHKLTKDQEDYLTTLADLVAVYEENHITALPKLKPHELLAAHLENIGMSASAWGKLIGIDRSTASRLLRGERKLNTEHIRKTSAKLNISVSALI